MPASDFDRQLPYLVARANRVIHAQLHARLKERGVPVEQWRILTALADGQGRSMGELAETVLMNHSALTKTIDRMVMRALVHRRHDPADNRRVLVYVSEFGEELLAACNREVDGYQSALAAKLGAAKAAQLRDLLDSLVAE
jgi:DNA-binding MarR family transcriptional regulator